MPATVLTPSKAQAVFPKPGGHPRSVKTRIVRRRGRARGTIDSDDELEREARSDSGSDDDKSSLDSDSDDDSVHSENVLRDGHSAAVTPSTTQSPQPDDKRLPIDFDPSNNHSRLNGDASGPFDSVATDWSEMVSEESAWATVPFIMDFNKLDAIAEQQPKPPITPRSRKGRKGDKKSKNRENPVVPQDPQNEQSEVQPIASTSRRGSPFPPRGGRSAREAYQTRLQADPSYVPTVGEFWGHDDRLLDKELRSLSGWWRGRWQGAGRGRGVFANRGRGGAFLPAGWNLEEHEQEGTEGDPVPPIERPWGHDGFEEMKKREEQRRQQAQQQEPNLRSTPLRRGMGGFRGGRGGFFPPRGRGFNGGRFTSSPRSGSTHSDRPWFAMKPERMWTKQLDWFLHSDSSLKPRLGQGQGFRVKLAGTKKEHVVRTPPRRYSFPQPSNPATTTQIEVVQHENEDKSFIVRIPTRVAGNNLNADARPLPATEPESSVPLSDPDSTTVETEESLEEVFTVKPRTAPSAAISVPRDSISMPIASSSQQSFTTATSPQARSELIERAVVKSPLSQPPVVSGENTILHARSPPKIETRPPPPVLPPIQTVFPPVAPQTQDFNTPYSYGPALPPGVALNPQGMAYEIATGRPVYLQPTPPPLYDPRPIMPAHLPLHAGGVPFVPGHVHHHSNASPDFLASHSHSRTSSMIDPMTGMPIFSLPRQNSRIEIRRPTDVGHHPVSKSPSGHAHRPSGLRTAVSALEAAAAEEEETQQSEFPDYYPSITDGPPTHSATLEEHAAGTHHSGVDPNAIPYQPYQPYYYPEYGYPYVDPSQMQYDMYQDHNTQPTIYY